MSPAFISVRQILLVLLITFNTCVLFSQTNTLQGSLKDRETGEPLVGAVIRGGNDQGAASNIDGLFTIKVSGIGDSLKITMLGYLEYIHVISESDFNGVVQILMSPVANEMKVVVVSAGKFEQDVNEVTVSMEVLQPEMLRDKNVVSADEALQQTPGVSIVDKEPQIRSGSGYSFGAGSRVQILVDDMPALSGDAGRPSWDYLPVENISQVEVIKGASSVLYGSAALSGVINVRTAYPSDTARTVVNVYHGVFSNPQSDSSVYWTGNLQRTGVNFLHMQKFGQSDFVISGNAVGDDGHLGPIKDTLTGDFVNGYNPFSVDRYNANSRARLSMNYRYRSPKVAGLSYGINTNWNISNSLATLLWAQVDTGLYAAFDGSATRTIQVMGTVDPFVTYFNKKGNKHSLRGRWQSLDNDNDNNQGNFSDQFYSEYQYQHNWEDNGIKNMTTTFGVVGIYTDARGQLFTGGNEDGHNTAKNFAGFFQIDKKFKDRLNVSAGVRYEYFDINNVSDAKPVFRAGVNYKIAKATFIRSSFGQGYRFPSIAEKFIVTGVGSINIFANPDLVAETSYNAELGIKQGFKIGDFMGYADVAVFQQEYKNFIEFTFGQWKYVSPLQGFNDLPRFQSDIQKSIGFKSVNTGKARIRGGEFSVMGEGNIGDLNIQLLAGYTYTLPVSLTPDFVYGIPPNGGEENFAIPDEYTYRTTSSDSTNNILKYRMQHLVRGDIAFKWHSVLLGTSVRYNSHMQNIDRAFEDLETVPAANFNPGVTKWRNEHTTGDYVFDLRIGYSINSAHRISVVVNNLLNREYAIRPLAIEEPRLTMIQYVVTL